MSVEDVLQGVYHDAKLDIHFLKDIRTNPFLSEMQKIAVDAMLDDKKKIMKKIEKLNGNGSKKNSKELSEG